MVLREFETTFRISHKGGSAYTLRKNCDPSRLEVIGMNSQLVYLGHISRQSQQDRIGCVVFELATSM